MKLREKDFMLIDSGHCYNSFTIIHFRLPYKIIYNLEEYRCTLVYQKEYDRFVIGDVSNVCPFDCVTPKNVRLKIKEWLLDPLNEIEKIKELNQYVIKNGFKLEYAD